MKLFKFLISLAITVSLLYLLNNQVNVGGTALPPLGKLLDPFHGFWQNAQNDSLPYYANIQLEGLKGEVKVHYDEFGIPHIFAENNHDLYMAQGYIVAQHRLWQMEFQTHAAAGRVAEIVGDGALNFDRGQRRKGMVFGAERTYELMKADKETFEYIEAYANGVNQYINSLSYKDLPVEYKLLDYRPEEWTSFKSALILEYMIDALTGYDEDFESSNALQMFGKETFDLLFPESLLDTDPVTPTDSANQWAFEPLEIDTPKLDLPTDLVQNVLPKPDPDNGSNNWAVAGSKTKSGKPILANDTHLGLNLPSLWILLQLHSPDVNVMGFTFTGAAGITIGFNENAAWGFTNAPRDHKDWYKIEFQDESRSKYKYKDQWQPTTVKIEEIKVKGQDVFYDTVIYTHHGPVVYDKSFGDDDGYKNFALRWIGHDPSRVQTALLHLNRVSTHEDYVKAIEYWDAPPQNIVFATTHGDIALRVQGNYVAKWKDQGKFLMDGNNPLHEWQTLVPKAQNAFQLNPERGFVSSANQHPVDSLYPYWTYSPTYETYRNRIINRMLSAADDVTPQDMMTMQQNGYGILPEEILPLMLDSLIANELTDKGKAIVDSLKSWDYHYTVGSKTATYFQVWWSRLYRSIWDEFRIEDVALEEPSYFTTIHLMKNYPTLEFYDIDSTDQKETLKLLINESFNHTIDFLELWKEERNRDFTWGNYKATYVRHLADLGGSLAGFSSYNIQVQGEANTINSTKRNHGPSQRLVVEMTSPPQAWGIYPGGQSGNPGSPLYDNMIELWRTGAYHKLLFMLNKEESQNKIIFTQTFESK
ncbi:MAG: penicillin acylase family protein [Bacteroidota bacterium]